MFSSYTLFRLALILVLTILVLGIVPGTLVFADGTGENPLPPLKAPSYGGDIGYDLLINAILTTLEFTT